MATQTNYLVSAEYASQSNDILFNKGKTFYWAKFFLSKHAAQRATRLYRFCRYIDDLADEAPDKIHALDCLNKIKADLNVGESNDIIVMDALALFVECHIPAEIPIELINGVMADLSLVRIKTEAQLLEYCYQVAGTVGIMMCKVLNVSNQKALYHAIDLGIAMQLTNIARDVYADALMDRIYLPESITGPLTPDDVIGLDDVNLPDDEKTLGDSNLRKLIKALEALLKQADQYYASGYAGLVHLPFRSRVSILIAAKLYQQIGFKIKRTHFSQLKTKVFIPLNMKLMLSIKVCFNSIFDRKFWFYNTIHHKPLHQHINKLPFCNG